MIGFEQLSTEHSFLGFGRGPYLRGFDGGELIVGTVKLDAILESLKMKSAVVPIMLVFATLNLQVSTE